MSIEHHKIMDFGKAIDFIKSNNNFLLTTHVNPDGDGVCALAALIGLLKELGKEYRVILDDPPQEKFSFLERTMEFEIYDESMLNGSFNSSIILDTANLDRIGSTIILLSENASILNIDHHVSNTGFGTYNLIISEYAATAHIMAEIFRKMDISPDLQSATALFAGICADTGQFRFDNTKSDTLSVSAWLVEAGADPELVARNLFNQNSLETSFGLGKMLSSIELHKGGKVAIAHMDNEFLDSEMGQKIDTDNFANQPLTIKGVEVALLFKEYSKGVWRVNFRSRRHVDVNELAMVFGGGGHPRASGATIEGKLEEVKKRLLQELGKFM